MKLNLDELSKAVAAVAGIAAEHAAMKAEYEAMRSDMTNAQVAVDAFTASLVAATTSPAGAVGLAAVAAALDAPQLPLPPPLPMPPVEADDVLANLK